MTHKIFICFSTAERELAARLHSDLTTCGADVFQFEKTAVPGTAAWTPVLDAIKEADSFIALLSQSAVASGPVKLEIQTALYYYANKTKPRLIPVLLEEVKKPKELVIFTDLPFSDYKSGLATLVEALELSGRVEPEAAPTQQPERVVESVQPTPEMMALLRANPIQVSVEDPVIWQASVRNSGNTAIKTIDARFSGRPLGPAFSLEPGEERKLLKEQITFDTPGPKTRTLSVAGISEDGTKVTSRSQAMVNVRESMPAGLQMLTGKGARTSADKLLEKGLKLDEDQFREIYGGAPRSWWDSEILWGGVVIMIALAAVVLGYTYDGWLLIWLPEELPGWLDSTILWIADHSWARWLVVILGLLIIPIPLAVLSDAWVIPLEGWEYAWSAILTSVLVNLAMHVPLLLVHAGFGPLGHSILMSVGMIIAGVVAVLLVIEDM